MHEGNIHNTAHIVCVTTFDSSVNNDNENNRY